MIIANTLTLGEAVWTLSYERELPARTVARLAREHAGMSQEVMGRELGVSRWTVLRVEEGSHRFHGALAKRWCELTNIPYEWIQHETGWKDKVF